MARRPRTQYTASLGPLAGYLAPFAGWQGTRLEALIWQELARRQVPFYYKYPWGSVPFLDTSFYLDFYLPDYRIVIEVQGTYWASLPWQMQKDALKRAVLSALGYQVYVFYDTMLQTPGDARTLLNSIPALRQPAVKGAPYDGGRPGAVFPRPEPPFRPKTFRESGSRGRRRRSDARRPRGD